ncbi:MAG: phosphate ABC transporter ATP-binding protein [Burkholderiaceae bacterium]|nr:phosphate ABC transporter ATP-binding protein [Burkholderiaceae bacterium]
MGSVLSLRGVNFQVGDKRLIDDVSMEIEQGSCFCIVGPSGSGKSTLIRLFNRLNVKTSGDILYRDHPIEFYPVSQLRHRIGMVFQRTTVFPGTVADNLKLALQFQNAKTIESSRFTTVLQQAGLKPAYLSENAELLSGGEQQRLGIARALVIEPDVLCLDEPTSALDVEAAHQVIDTVKSLRGKMTVVMVNHRLEEVEEVATHVALIDGGKIIEMGTSDEFFQHPQTDRLKAFLAAYRRKGGAS